MTDLAPGVSSALMSLRTRWGAAAPRRLGEADGAVGEVIGALAIAPLPDSAGTPDALPPPGSPSIDEDRVVRTGFPALDAILGPGGVPRSAALTLRGAASSGKTTLALRLVAEAQASGSIVGYVDLGRSLDPVEAVARGVRLEWLVVLEPASLDEALAMAGALVTGRAVDLLLIDLPARPSPQPAARAAPDRNGRRPPSAGERIGRLVALARRAGVLLVVLEPPGLPDRLSSAIAESAGLRLELAWRSWIRLGHDVVGQRSEVVVGRNRYGLTGRQAELRILYAEGGDRDACLRREALLTERDTNRSSGTIDRATSPSPLATPSAPSRQGAADRRPELRVVPGRASRPRRSTVDGRDRPRRQPGCSRARCSARDATRERPPAHS